MLLLFKCLILMSSDPVELLFFYILYCLFCMLFRNSDVKLLQHLIFLSMTVVVHRSVFCCFSDLFIEASGSL